MARPLNRPPLLAGVALAALALAACDGPSTPAAVPTSQAAVATPGPAAATATAPAKVADNPISHASAWGQGGKADIDTGSVLDDNEYVVLDGSGSMGSGDCSSHTSREGRMADAKTAIVRFERGIPAATNLGLYVFDGKGWGERVPLGRGPQNRAAFEAAVNAVSSGGNTPLGASIDTAFNVLRAKAETQGGYGTYRIVVETDGEPTGGSDPMGDLRRSVDKVAASPVILETLGFCITDKDHPLNRPGVTIYHEAQDPTQLTKGLDAILAETDAFTDDAVPSQGAAK